MKHKKPVLPQLYATNLDAGSSPRYQPGTIWQPDLKAQLPSNPLPLTSDMLSNGKPERSEENQS